MCVYIYNTFEKLGVSVPAPLCIERKGSGIACIIELSNILLLLKKKEVKKQCYIYIVSYRIVRCNQDVFVLTQL